jgi:hypothetical protein
MHQTSSVIDDVFLLYHLLTFELDLIECDMLYASWVKLCQGVLILLVFKINICVLISYRTNVYSKALVNYFQNIDLVQTSPPRSKFNCMYQKSCR